MVARQEPTLWFRKPAQAFLVRGAFVIAQFPSLRPAQTLAPLVGSSPQDIQPHALGPEVPFERT